MKYPAKQILEELEEIITGQVQYLDAHIMSLDDKDLNWRPEPYRWTILEVVEHLNRFSDFYHPKFSAKISRPDTLKKSDHYKSGFLSEFAFKRVRPVDGVVPFKTKSLSKNNPFLRILDRDVLAEHRTMQKKFKKLIRAAEVLDLSKNKIPTMVGSWLKFNLGDSMRLHAYHNERHYIQIDNLVKKNY